MLVTLGRVLIVKTHEPPWRRANPLNLFYLIMLISIVAFIAIAILIAFILFMSRPKKKQIAAPLPVLTFPKVRTSAYSGKNKTHHIPTPRKTTTKTTESYSSSTSNVPTTDYSDGMLNAALLAAEARADKGGLSHRES